MHIEGWVVKKGARVINPGAKVKDFRGEVWEFLSISRLPDEGRSGKVVMRRGDWRQEFYHTVFDFIFHREES